MMRAALIFLLWPLVACAADSAARVCTAIETRCTERPRTVVIDGMSIERPCWQRTTRYACIATSASDGCTAPRARGCREVGAQCLEHATVAGTSLCMTEQREYACQTGGGETSTVADCAAQQYCIEGNCFATGAPADGDFRHAVAALEATREAGVHLDQRTLRIFRGEDRRCGKTVLRNCCKADNGELPALVGRVTQAGSPGTNDAASGIRMPDAAVASPLAAGQTQPASRNVVTDLAPCDREETLTAFRARKGLCRHIGQYCARRLRLGLVNVCLERKETYCCFNSKIARLIAEAARAQLAGMHWGTPDKPSCQGISVEQFQQLDLSRVDFTDIYRDIRPATGRNGIGQPTPPAVRSYFEQ